MTAPSPWRVSTEIRIGVQSFFLTEYLASHGYIVVCPDHTGNALLTQLPDGTTIGPGGQDRMYANAGADRIADVSFLVDALSDLNDSDPDGRFTGKVDLEHVGYRAFFGGLTSDGMRIRASTGLSVAPECRSRKQPKPILYFWARKIRRASEPSCAYADHRLRCSEHQDAGHFRSPMASARIGDGDAAAAGDRVGLASLHVLPDVRVHAITKYDQTAVWAFL